VRRKLHIHKKTGVTLRERLWKRVVAQLHPLERHQRVRHARRRTVGEHGSAGGRLTGRETPHKCFPGTRIRCSVYSCVRVSQLRCVRNAITCGRLSAQAQSLGGLTTKANQTGMLLRGTCLTRQAPCISSDCKGLVMRIGVPRYAEQGQLLAPHRGMASFPVHGAALP